LGIGASSASAGDVDELIPPPDPIWINADGTSVETPPKLVPIVGADGMLVRDGSGVIVYVGYDDETEASPANILSRTTYLEDGVKVERAYVRPVRPTGR